MRLYVCFVFNRFVVVNMSQETDKFIKNIVDIFHNIRSGVKHSVSMLIQDKVQYKEQELLSMYTANLIS